MSGNQSLHIVILKQQTKGIDVSAGAKEGLSVAGNLYWEDLKNLRKKLTNSLATRSRAVWPGAVTASATSAGGW